jgi:autotransporter-associated beta strand protein
LEDEAMTSKQFTKCARGIASIGPAAAAAVAALVLAGAAQAETVTWAGGNMTWSNPDTDSFGASQYDDGDTANFTGTGVGNIAIASGGVAPGAINLSSYTQYRFNIGEDSALGTGPISIGYSCPYTFINTKGSEVALANNISVPGGHYFWFQGGSFRLTGTVTIGATTYLTLDAGTTITFENGVAGAGKTFSICEYSGGAGTVRINGASSASCNRIYSGATIQIGADNALGPAGTECLIATSTSDKLEAVGGVRSIDSGLNIAGILTFQGTNNLAVNGSMKGSGYLYQKSTQALAVNGDNSTWASYVEIHSGALRAGHTNALGTTGINFWGGVLELGAADLSRTLASDAGGNSGKISWRQQSPGPCDGGFSAYGGDRSVTLDAGATLTWGSTPGFVSSGKIIIFGSTQSNGKLTFQNPINLNNAVRTIRVNDNPNSTADRAVMAGVLSGTGSSGITKTGDGTLFFDNDNTYTGATTVSTGAVGGNGSLGGNLVLSASSGFCVDWAALTDPLDVAGAVDLSNADTLTVLGTPSTQTRTVILKATGGINGTFDTVTGLDSSWKVDYSVAGEVALKPSAGGTVVSVQ